MEKKEEFLVSAIGDVQETIHFLDTKVGFIMGIIGIFGAALVGCKSNIYYIYNQLRGVWYCIYIMTIIMYTTTNIMVLYFSIKAIIPSSNKSEIEIKRKIWYSDQNSSFNEYLVNVKNIQDGEIVELLAYELFCINNIRRSKEDFVKRAIQAFSGSIISLGTIACFMMMVYV